MPIVFGQTPSQTQKDNPNAGDRITLAIHGIEYAFRWCPPDTFIMGSPPSEADRNNNEFQHQVVLSRGFWMFETEVTQEMWGSIMNNNPSRFKGGKLPVEQISWNDSQEYIKKLNDLGIAPAGFTFSLPTEAQWEHACRAGTTTAYHFGRTLSREQANLWLRNQQTVEVGSYPANDWGLHDMHGNVWEWCLDWYDEYPSGTINDPAGPLLGSYRIIRGGSWCVGARLCRSAYRGGNAPALKNDFLGLRLALVDESW